MNKFVLYFFGFILGIGLTQGVLSAEMVQGEVTATNRQNQSVTILMKDSSGLGKESKELILSRDVQFAGIRSLEDLEIGDKVKAEVNKKMFRKDEVKLLTAEKKKTERELRAVRNSVGKNKLKTSKPISLYTAKKTGDSLRSKELSNQSHPGSPTAGNKAEI